ncbi:transcriptional regulator FnrL [Yoonia sp. R2331]|uniref:transcriptional regulator FnrL n=1 Tax=Yoonia sp. R2331 TaxID=3237238 RepID=UPI0034E3B747
MTLLKFDTSSSVRCTECPIRHRAVCARCDDDELSVLESMKSYKSFTAGQTILSRGDDLTYVGSVVQGMATLSKTLEDGRTQMVGMLMPSDFVGWPGRTHIDFDVAAMTDTTLCCFQRKPFEKMLSETPHVAQRLAEMALDELDAARDWMVLLGRKTAREKIATFIEMLARRTEHPDIEGQTHSLTMPMTREQMANNLGLTLETVSRQINGLKNDGVIAFKDRRTFDVLDQSALKSATGD